MKPKDIVSGDFYWSIEKNGYWYIAAADCTGHGVPGAFMSMLGIAFLNEITAGEKLLSPAEILDRLRAKIVKELHQTGASGESKDGMDISLACLNLTTRELQWAGANNSVYIVNDSASTNGATFTTGATFTNGGAAIREKGNSLPAVTLKEIKGDKQPIGYHHQFKEFTNHTIELVSGNVLYLFTDGYADQFGGPAGKKFMYQRFENLLISIAHLNVHEQKHMLATTFEDWKKDLEQLDDVCVIGIRI